jgi:Kef-type K+ transport system membrane component KefB
MDKENKIKKEKFRKLMKLYDKCFLVLAAIVIIPVFCGVVLVIVDIYNKNHQQSMMNPT